MELTEELIDLEARHRALIGKLGALLDEQECPTSNPSPCSWSAGPSPQAPQSRLSPMG